MRQVTVNPATKKEPKPQTIGNLKKGTWFTCQRWPTEWMIRTGSDSHSAVTVHDGTLLTGFLGEPLVKVLADGESLTIGPEVKDGE